jgi:hydrogenase maturation protease
MTGEPIAYVIGYGNTLRGDDGVGPRAATAVESWGLRGVRSLAIPQLTPELAEPISSARLVIFVDASLATREGAPSIDATTIEPIERSARIAISSNHSSDPRRLLALANRIYGRCPPAWLLSITAENFGIGEEISPTAARGLDAALGRIAAILNMARAAEFVPRHQQRGLNR